MKGPLTHAAPYIVGATLADIVMSSPLETELSFNARKPSLLKNMLARIQFVCLYWGYITQRSGTGARPVVPKAPLLRR